MESLSDIIEKDVFTAKGIYSGRVTDLILDLDKFRVKSLIVEAVKGSFLSQFVGDKKGVIIPFNLIEAIGDIVIIKHVTPEIPEEEGESEIEEISV